MQINKPKSLLIDLIILLIINTILAFLVFPKIGYSEPPATGAILQHFMDLDYNMLFYMIIIQYILLFLAYLSYIYNNKFVVYIFIIEGVLLFLLIYGFFMIEHAIEYNYYLKKLDIIKKC